MLPLEHPDRIQISFDDHRLVNNAGLLLPVTLAQHMGLRKLVDNHVDLGDATRRANMGDKMLTLVASALAGGDCIDDADVLRTGRTARTLGCVVKAPSTLGTFLRSFRWGHRPPVGSGEPRVSRAVDVQGECPLNCSAKMSLGYSGIVSDVDAGRLAGDRRVGGFSASM